MDSASQILDVAERRMRQAGYNAVSYRDIAAEIGVKSASLHYHFPKKEDLGVALVRRYADNIYARLAAQTAVLSTPQEKITALVDLYRYALEEQRLVCLCAVLGAEAPGLPHPVVSEVRTFFQTTIAWLAAHYADLKFKEPERQAKAALSALKGAMIISAVNDDKSVFDAAAQSVCEQLAD